MRGWVLAIAACCVLSAANTRLFAVHDGQQCGYAEASGKVIIAPQFRDCGDFSEGLAPVQVGDRWGYIDETGASVIAPQFLEADAFSENLAFVTVDAQKKAVIDRQGKILFRTDYYEHDRFSEGLAAVHPVYRTARSRTWNCGGVSRDPGPLRRWCSPRKIRNRRCQWATSGRGRSSRSWKRSA